MIVTRFAPSPTGYLHIGGARTALFNYLFAKKHGGKFLIRVEDTDNSRHVDQAVQAIFDSLKWLGVQADEEPIYQSKNIERHREIAYLLVEKGLAYYCAASPEDIENMREEAREKGENYIFRGEPNQSDNQAKKGAIRLKVNRNGKTIIRDLLQGDVEFDNALIEDFVIMRSDQTPTYMLAATVDDHDMNISHIIRGDDHLNNAAKQQIIYQALGWDVPKMVHIPLIHGSDGSKLSKRHGALSAGEYQKMGFLPEALLNYLVKLGWSHGDDEIISMSQAMEWFDIKGLGKGPARLDITKLTNINSHYIKLLDDHKTIEFIKEYSEVEPTSASLLNINKALPDIRQRSNLTIDLAKYAQFYYDGAKIELMQETIEIIAQCPDNIINEIGILLGKLGENSDIIQQQFKDLAKEHNLKLGQLMAIVRPLITGQKDAPSMFNLLAIIGRDEAIERFKQAKGQIST